jgi:putative sigma-54 modulation protein
MKVNIQSIHFDADIKLLNLITKKVEKAQTFFENIEKAMVYLKIEKDSHHDNKVIEIKINLEGHEVFAKEQSNTFETALDLVMDKIIAQIKKHKEKLIEKN